MSVPETKKYRAVSSGKIPFTILPRPATLVITAVGDQSTESAKVIVTIVGALSDIEGKFVDLDVAYDEPGAMSTRRMRVARLNAQAAANAQAQIEIDSGSLVATHEFPHVGAGEYEVTASYSKDPNYIVKDETKHFDKRMRGYRIAAEDKTVTFGAEPFAVQANVRDSNGSEVADPTLSYSRISSEDLPIISDDVVELGDKGIVNVRNAGVSAIRVDVAGNDTHEGNFDYAMITVEKAPLPLTVTAQDKVVDGKPAEEVRIESATVSARIPGPLSEVCVDLGDKVVAGETKLFAVDSATVSNQVVIAREAAATAPETSWGLCLLGAAVAGIVGYWALKFLLRSLKSQWFWLFGPYCLVAGAVALLLS